MGARALTSSLKKFAAVVIAASAMLGTVASPAVALDAFDLAEAYLGSKYGVPDFKFNRSEFGNSNFVRIVHLKLEIFVEFFHGAYVVYVPATGERKVFRDQGPGYSEPTQTRETMATCGPGHWFIYTVGTNPENNKWCVPAHLVGNSGGLTLDYVIPGTPRSCTFEVNSKFSHEHSC